MAYLQNNSAFIPNGSSRCLPHSNQCDEINCSLAKQFEDAKSYAQCPIYYDHWRTGVQSVLHNDQSLMKFIELFCSMTNCRMCRRRVVIVEHWPNANEKRCSYGTLAKRKREKVMNERGNKYVPVVDAIIMQGRDMVVAKGAKTVDGPLYRLSILEGDFYNNIFTQKYNTVVCRKKEKNNKNQGIRSKYYIYLSCCNISKLFLF